MGRWAKDGNLVREREDNNVIGAERRGRWARRDQNSEQSNSALLIAGFDSGKYTPNDYSEAVKIAKTAQKNQSKEISESDSVAHANKVLAGVNENDRELLKKYVTAKDMDTTTPFAYLGNTDSPVMQQQKIKYSETMESAKKDFMKNTGVDEKTFNNMVENYSYLTHSKENQEQKKELKESGKATKALASVVDVLASPVTGILSLAGTGKSNDPELGRDNHTVYASLKDFSENTESAVMEDAEQIDNKALSNVAKYGYQIGMATGKSAMSAATGGAAASGLGLTGASARAVANMVTLPQFGAASYTSTLEDAQERGLDTKKAYETAIVAGIAEMATEVISLEGIWDIMEQQGKVAAKTVLANTLKQGFFEGSEEAANDVINEAADRIINQDQSTYQKSLDYFMSEEYALENGLESTLDISEAKKLAGKQFAKQVGEDFMLGAATGGIMGGAATGVNSWARTQAGKSIAENEDLLNDIVDNQNSENYISDDREDYDNEEDYQKAQDTILQVIDDSGKKISGKEARNLYDNVAQSIESQNDRRVNAQMQQAINEIKNARSVEEFVKATENVKNRTDEVAQAEETARARLKAQGATEEDFNNVLTKKRAYVAAKNGDLSEDSINTLQGEVRRAAEMGMSESVAEDVKNISKFDATTVLVKDVKGKPKQMTLTGEVTKDGDTYYLTTKGGTKVKMSEDILSGKTKENGDNTKGKLLMYGNSHAEGIVSLEDPELMTAALQTKMERPSVPSTSIVRAIKTFHTLGAAGVSFESVVKDKHQKFMVDAVGEKTLRKAFDIGAKEGAADEAVAANPDSKRGIGKVTFDGSDENVQKIYESIDHASKIFLEKIAEKTGVEIELFADDSDTEGTVRGQYVPEHGKIRLNIADGTDIFEVAMHEGVGEFLKAHNAQGYADITETVLTYYAENNADALAKRIEDYKRAYQDEDGKTTRGSADELVNDVLGEIFTQGDGIEKLGNWLFETGREKEAKTIKDVFLDFVKQMKEWIADIKEQGGLSNAERSRVSMTEKDIDALQDRILKAMDEAIENRDDRAGQEISRKDVRNSIKVDANGKQYVEIDEDIINGITDDKQIKEYVREYIRAYHPSLNAMGIEVVVNRKSRAEFTNSEYTKKLQRSLRNIFLDKMRVAGNLEEIVRVGDGYTWENIKHSRKDSINGFVRGKVNIKVGNNAYIADIVLANQKKNGLMFYDIVSMNNTSIKETTNRAPMDETSAAQTMVASTDSISQNGENATRNSLKVDSKGRKLSDEQMKYFTESKVRDENGKLLVMYHGTPYGGFTRFKNELNYFTSNEKYADRYQEPSASSNRGYYEPATSKETYEVYLNISKPFDLRNEKDRDIFINEYVNQWSASSYDKERIKFEIRNGIDWTEADNLKEFFDEQEYDYDGLVLNEGGDDKYGDRGMSYVTFNPEQIKNVDNLNPTDSEDIRYSKKVEQARASIKEYGEASPYNQSLNEVNVIASILGKVNDALDGVTIDYNVAKNVADHISDKYESDIDRSEFSSAIWQVFDYMNQNQMGKDYTGMMDYLLNIGDEVIATSHMTDPMQQDTYNQVRRALSKHQIRLTESDKKELTHKFGTWQAAFGAIQKAGINLNNNGLEIDAVYPDIREEIMQLSGVQMDESMTAADQIVNLIDTVNVLEPGPNLWEGANDIDKSLTVVADIIDAYYTRAMDEMAKHIVEGTDAGKKAISDAVKKQTDKLRKEMKQYKKTVGQTYQQQVKRYKDELTNTQNALRDVQKNLQNWKPTPEMRYLNEEQIETTAKVRAEKALTDYKMAQEREKQLNNIRRTGHRLIRWLDQPTDKQHVPEFLQKPLAEFLSSIDFLPNRAKEDSKNTQDWKQKMYVLKDIMARIKDAEDDVKESEEQYFSQVIVAEEIESKMQELLDKNNGNQLKISQLLPEDLKNLSEIMSALSTSINHMNTTYANARYAGIEQLARTSVKEMRKRKPLANMQSKAGKVLFDFLNMEEVEPLTYFEQLGEAATSIYEELRQGFDRKTKHIRDTADFFEQKKKELGISDKEMAEWSKQSYDFHFQEGTLTLTVPQIMSLKETVGRKQGKPHVEAGGIKVADAVIYMGKKKKIFHQSKAVHIKEEEYQQIVSKLTYKQRQMADVLQKYMASECAKWGNRVSKEMYGYKKFQEKDYFPIKTDPNSRGVNVSSDNVPSYYTIKNRSFTKAITPQANNAVIIDDIFDVFTRHVVQMAEYDGYTMPIADAMRWFNYAEKDISEIRESVTGDISDTEHVARLDIKNSVQENIEYILGEQGKMYFRQFIKDINGDAAGQGGQSDLLNAAMSMYKAQAVGANIRVIIQQPTAIIRAMSRIEGRYLAEAQASIPQAMKYAKKAQENSQIAYWKAQGYYETLLGKSLKQIITGESTVREKMTEISGKGAGIADDLSWGLLYRAAEIKVKDNYTELEYDSEAFTKRTVEIFEDIIDHTQVVDTLFHKSQWMRNKELGHKMTSAFMAEPTKTYNMLYRAFMDYKMNKTDEAKKKFGKIAMIFFVEQSINAAITAIIDAARDDEKESWLQAYKEHFADNLTSNVNPLNFFPMTKEISSAIEGYDATSYVTEGLYTAVDTAKEIMKIVTGKSNKTLYGQMYQIAKAISQLTGVPISNAIREVKTIHNTVNDLWNGTDWFTTEEKKKEDENNRRQKSLADAIQEGDLKKSKSAMNDIYENAYKSQIESGKDAVEAESEGWSAVRRALKKEYQNDIASGTEITVANNRYVALLQNTKMKVPGKNEFKSMTKDKSKELLKKWAE